VTGPADRSRIFFGWGLADKDLGDQAASPLVLLAGKGPVFLTTLKASSSSLPSCPVPIALVAGADGFRGRLVSAAKGGLFLKPVGNNQILFGVAAPIDQSLQSRHWQGMAWYRRCTGRVGARGPEGPQPRIPPAQEAVVSIHGVKGIAGSGGGWRATLLAESLRAGNRAAERNSAPALQPWAASPPRWPCRITPNQVRNSGPLEKPLGLSDVGNPG